MPKMRMRQAIGAALADEMEADPTVFVMGEDVGAGGGAFKATEGLYERFGAARVRDTPISETGFLGAGVGAAAQGLRPVVEIMFIEFIGVALDQLNTEAASMRYLSRGEYSVPMTVRAAAGAGLGYGCQHSQMLEHWFRGTAGITVVVPSSPQSAYGLLRAAVQSDDPVVFLEPKALYGMRDEVETGDHAVLPLGKAAVDRHGSDVTIVGLGSTCVTARRAAELGGWDAEVIDLRTVAPWDRETVLESAAKTSHLVVIEEGPYTGGWSSEICDAASSELWGQLKAPALRITAPDVPIPYAKALEARFLPTAELVVAQIDELLASKKRPTPWWQKENR